MPVTNATPISIAERVSASPFGEAACFRKVAKRREEFVIVPNMERNLS